MTSQLIESSLSDCPSNPVKTKVECCRLQTAQPPGSHTQALHVTTHSQQVISLSGVGGYTSAEVLLVYSIAPAIYGM